MTPEVVERGDRLIVSAPFNRRWRRWASQNAGHWAPDSRTWIFHVALREAVEEALARIFGEEEA